MRVETTAFEANTSTNVRSDRYWGGFAAGALIGTAAAVTAVMIANALSRNRDHRILRMEDSIQIARPVEEVFRAWADFRRLPDFIEALRHVEVQDNRSIWTVETAGKQTRWEAETVQFIPNEAIGWKSISGPKHTGRISFSPLGDGTIVHVTMNYASPLGRFSLLAAPATSVVSSVINEALRDFKAHLEGRSDRHSQRSSATVGWREPSQDISLAEETRKAPASVDYTRPPKAKYP